MLIHSNSYSSIMLIVYNNSYVSNIIRYINNIVDYIVNSYVIDIVNYGVLLLFVCYVNTLNPFRGFNLSIIVIVITNYVNSYIDYSIYNNSYNR